MVTRTILALSAALSALHCAAAAPKPSAPAAPPPATAAAAAAKGTLCVTHTVGMGQRTYALWCQGDSCTVARYANNNYTPGRVGLYAVGLPPGALERGRALAGAAIGRKDWTMDRATPILGLTVDDSLKRSVSVHPKNGAALADLQAWVDSLLDLPRKTIWSDSLMVVEQKGPISTVEVFLQSRASRHPWFGRVATMKVPRSHLTVVPRDNPDSRDADSACVAKVIAGKKCEVGLQKDALWARAILKAMPAEANLYPGKACLDARFELVSEWAPLEP